MEVLHGSFAWIFCLEVLHGSFAMEVLQWKFGNGRFAMEVLQWKFCVQVLHGSFAWKCCMEVLHPPLWGRRCLLLFLAEGGRAPHPQHKVGRRYREGGLFLFLAEGGREEEDVTYIKSNNPTHKGGEQTSTKIADD